MPTNLARATVLTVNNVFMARVRRLRPEAVDGILAAALLAIDVVVAAEGEPQRSSGSTALTVVILLASSVPIAWRRRRPTLVLAVAFSALLAHEALGYPDAPLLGAFVALYSVGAYVDRRTSAVAGAAAIVAYTALRLFNVVRYDESIVAVIPNLAVVVMVWIVGANVRKSRTYAAQLEEKALQLEREREERARRAVADERARIARELHDVVAHNVSVMVVQAGGGRRVLGSRPEGTREALESIERTGRQALTEMRRLLGILREEDQSTGPLEPQPGLDRLHQLAVQMEEAGLAVDLAIEGPPRALPAGVELSAYRIIQEALTNTLRHAGPARAKVVVRYGEGALEVEVIDDGRGVVREQGDGELGQGLIGMKERAALLGGRFHAGPRTGGGYAVSVRLPVETTSA